MIISGQVLSTSNEPLMGANIYAQTKNGKEGVIADFDGNFNWEVKNELTSPVTISYLGYTSRTFEPNDLDNRKVILNESAEQLDEVVVTYQKPKSKKKQEKNKLIGIISIGAGILALGIILINIKK